MYEYVYVQSDRETCWCQLKNINARGDAGAFIHYNMHYMHIHAKLCVNMHAHN